MDQKQFEAMLSDAEIRLRRLKTLYDQWFSGLERIEPQIPRKELDDLLGKLKREQVRNTALKFRLQQVHSRYVTQNTYWKRIARQIEEGTYQRDVLRARKLREQRAREPGSVAPSTPPGHGDHDVDVDVDLDAALAAAQPTAASTPAAATSLGPSAPPAAPPAGPPRAISPFALPIPGAAQPAASAGPRPPPPPPPRPGAAPARPPAPPQAASAPGGGGGLSNDDVQRIYARYLAARKANSERTDNVKMETIEKSLRGMLPQLAQKHAGKKIDFEVVVKDGKVALKPVAK
jgi:hypothetical protein